MTEEEFAKLKRGDIIKHWNSAKTFVIEHILAPGGPYIAVRTQHVSNAREWEKIDAYPDKVERS